MNSYIINRIRKKIYYFLVLNSLAFFSCNSKSDQPNSDNNIDTIQSPIIYAWQARINDSTGKLTMEKVEVGDLDTLSPAGVITYLNNVDSKVQLELSKVSNDTVYLKIPNANYLTQQMGSEGATMIMAEIVYNLTEIPNIKFVNFDFKGGDHAVPGTYTRENFD